MPSSVTRALGSISFIVVAGVMLGVTGRGVWDMALSSVLWAVYIVCCKALVWPSNFVGKACVGAVVRGLGAARRKSKGRKLFWKTQILWDLNVRQHHCENVLQVGSEGICEWECALGWLFLLLYSNCVKVLLLTVHMPTESWYSEPLNQFMESAVGIVLKPLGLALEMGLHDDLRETKG